MSKVRIESKWYHESPNFHLVAVDALSIADQYIKVALFTLETPNPASETGSSFIPPLQQYSIDIGTNIAAAGSALGIDGAPSTHSAKVIFAFIFHFLGMCVSRSCVFASSSIKRCFFIFNICF